MTSEIILKNLKKTGVPRCIISEKDFDETLGGDFYMLLEPFNSWGEPMFYWRKNQDGTYCVIGEGYIVTDRDDISSHKRDVKSRWGYKKLKWVQVDEKGNSMK